MYFGLPRISAFTRQSLVGVVLAEDARNAEVADLDVELLRTVDHDVFQLQVAVHDFALVAVVDRVHDLAEDELGLAFADALARLSREVLGEVSALEVLHDEDCAHVLEDEAVQHLHDVLVAQVLQRVRLREDHLVVADVA